MKRAILILWIAICCLVLFGIVFGPHWFMKRKEARVRQQDPIELRDVARDLLFRYEKKVLEGDGVYVVPEEDWPPAIAAIKPMVVKVGRGLVWITLSPLPSRLAVSVYRDEQEGSGFEELVDGLWLAR